MLKLIASTFIWGIWWSLSVSTWNVTRLLETVVSGSVSIFVELFVLVVCVLCVRLVVLLMFSTSPRCEEDEFAEI